MQIEPVNLNPLVVHQLPDGSKVIVDAVNGTAYAFSSPGGSSSDQRTVPSRSSHSAEPMRR
jgi:hypothetical protein